jgi:pilus assembly protein CpaD
VALIAFVGRWREAAEAGDISVQTPAEGVDPVAATRTAAEALGALQALGVPSARVRTGDYPAPADAARVLVSFSSLEAHGPDCGGHWNNVTSTGSNRVTEHFGCAVTANFAAQVADPRDFLNPAGAAPADAGRREVVLGKYRNGEITSTPRDDQAVGAISGAVGSK